MRRSAERSGAAGCLLAAVAAAAGFGVWLDGSRPGLRGSFEGERDLSLLYVELPLMLLAFPALTLAAWCLAGAAMPRGAGRGARVAVSLLAGSATVLVLVGAGHMWLDSRVAPFVHPAW